MRSTPPGTNLLLATLAVLCAIVAAGCQTESVTTSDGRPLPPKPRPAPRTPAETPPNRMTLFVPRKAVDSDGNGYPDMIRVTAALFAYPHPTSIMVDGSFVFTLFEQGDARVADARPISQWRIEPDETALATAMYGPCYQFELSLLENGNDRLPAVLGDLRGQFEPADGGEVVHASDEPRMVQIGRWNEEQAAPR